MKKTLKLILVGLVVAALAVTVSACGGKKEAPAEKKSEPAPAAKKKVVLASDTAYAPFESQDPQTGKYVGFDIDLVNAIAEVANLDIEIRSMNFDGIIPALETASVDGAISAMTITDKRKQSVNFSVPYYLSGQSIAVRADNNAIKGWDDLKGKKLGVQISTTGADEARKVPNAKVTDYNTINEAFMALKSGAVDAVVNDYPVNAYFVKQSKDKDVKLVGELRTSEHYGIAFPKKNTELLDTFNKALKTLKDNGKYAEIYKKWFGADPPAYLPGEPPKQ
ncbi:MAG: basic amino acid ABC transporter substrate-binding protein [Peptococcaceae bacterium]|nr:basic amino acid ABC transporter substrate-binding protein [Peptococcaceae bacterium]